MLADDAPGIRDRLTGSPYEDDAEAKRQWQKYALPELAHLFESARTTVTRDLQRLAPDAGEPACFQIRIPAAHLPAWLSSLAAVRVALAETHDVSEKDMESPLGSVSRSKKQRALLQIHLLGWVQGLLIEAGA
jgi:hypothetical protein